MKYILMMQFPLSLWKTQRLELWPKQDAKAHMDFLKRFNQELIDAGEFVRTEGLGGPEQMKIVRATKTGAAAITDGPFPESKDAIAGYWILQVGSMDEAVEWAKRVPFEALARIYPGEYGATGEVEIRRVFEPESFPPAT